MKATFYVEVLSSWCYWAEPAWAEFQSRFAGRVECDWKIALMSPGDFPVSQAQCDWFYRRSGTIMRSPFMLNSGWMEPERAGHYNAPNLVAEAARDYPGGKSDKVRLEISHAAVREGQKMGDIALAAAVGAKVLGIDPSALRKSAESPEIKARVEASTAVFHAHQLTQRPAFILEDSIGDKAVFSGLVSVEVLATTAEAMLADTAGYAAAAAHLGKPPTQ